MKKNDFDKTNKMIYDYHMDSTIHNIDEGIMNIKQKNKNNKLAFTLAEVLITLAIIGVVAALTIPTLINKYQEKQVISALRKVHTTLNQAYLNIIMEHGYTKHWEEHKSNTISYKEATQKMAEKFIPYLKVAKNCGQNTNLGCFGKGNYYKIDGGETNAWDSIGYYYRISLIDGMSIMFYSRGRNFIKYNSGITNFGTFIVDVNGSKGPNTMGKDTFTFVLIDNSIIPDGHPKQVADYIMKDENGNTILDQDGNPVVSYDPLTDCNRKKCYEFCETCAAWILETGNMDYLHCDDLSWDGKRSCKEAE